MVFHKTRNTFFVKGRAADSVPVFTEDSHDHTVNTLEIMDKIVVFCIIHRQITAQQTGDFHPILVQCWPSVVDDGPTLYQHCVNVSCLLGKNLCQ